MKKYVSFDPEAQVIGQAMLGFQAAASKELINPLLKKYGLTDIHPDQWYPLQKWLDVLSDIERNAGASSMMTFVDIGISVAKNVSMPEDVERLMQKMGFIDMMMTFGETNYRRDHQGDVGQITYKKVSDQHLIASLITPYPPNFGYGILYGFAKRYCSSFVVHYEDISMSNQTPGEPVIIHTLVKT